MELIDLFINDCQKVGVKAGDLLYISSDITLMVFKAMKEYGLKGKNGRNSFINEFVDGLQRLVGQEGTLLIPMFTWQFCRKVPYDTRTTQGEVGSLGNWILANRDDFGRTEHPLYSFMVWGKDKSKLMAMKNRTAWSQDSPFAYMHHNNGKCLLVNIGPHEGFTFNHYVEETIRVPYRYFKDFKGEYVDAKGNSSERVYTMYVRDLDIESVQISPEDCLVDANAAVKGDSVAGRIQLIELDKAFDVVANNYRTENGSDWYDFKGYVIDWKAGQTHPNETSMVI